MFDHDQRTRVADGARADAGDAAPGKRPRTSRLSRGKRAASPTDAGPPASAPPTPDWCVDDVFGYGAIGAGEMSAPEEEVPPATEPAGAPSQRTYLQRILKGASQLHPLTFALGQLGYRVTGAAIGGRLTNSGAGFIGTSESVDGMFMVDLETMEVLGDTFPTTQVGLRAQLGPSGGAVFALRLSPAGPGGDLRSSYAGPTVGVSPALLASWGLAVSASLLVGQEGWVAVSWTAGAQAGVLTLSSSVSIDAALDAGRELWSRVAAAGERAVAWVAEHARASTGGPPRRTE